MRADSLTTARKIRQPIAAPGDIANAFDGITYGKGEAVIGIFENYLEAKEFQRAVRLYLQQHAWGNATSSDLLAAIDQIAPEKHAGTAFPTFLNQVGFPLVSVQQECAIDFRLRLFCICPKQASVPLARPNQRIKFGKFRFALSGKTAAACIGNAHC
jgi:aminopeptidase N